MKESGCLMLGTIQLRMPARIAAVAPATESSNTKQLVGSVPSLAAVRKKTSGLGFSWVTSSQVVNAEK